MSSTSRSRTGRMSRECMACVVGIRRQAISSFASWSSSRAMSASGPAATEVSGPLSAARSRPAPSIVASRAAGMATVSITPRGVPATRRARSITSLIASAGSKTPATVAAAYSPSE